MVQISLIAAIDKNLGLGKNNQLLCHLPADLKYFKQVTLGKPVIMGRKTYESIGRLLPGRQNIIISRQPLIIEGAEVAQSLQDSLKLTKDTPEVMIIGGAQIFNEALPLASTLYLTQINHLFDADVFFPAYSQDDWQEVSKKLHPQDEKNQYDMIFYTYQRK